MNPLLTLLLVLWLCLGGDSKQPPPKPTILGTWTLQSVHHVVTPRNGDPIFSFDAKLSSHASGVTITKDHRWLNLHWEGVLNTYTYRAFGDSLNVDDGNQLFRGRISELTPSRLVLLTQADTEESHLDITTTYSRVNSLRDLRKARLNWRRSPVVDTSRID